LSNKENNEKNKKHRSSAIENYFALFLALEMESIKLRVITKLRANTQPLFPY
jgi:hypothetical protein